MPDDYNNLVYNLKASAPTQNMFISAWPMQKKNTC